MVQCNFIKTFCKANIGESTQKFGLSGHFEFPLLSSIHVHVGVHVHVIVVVVIVVVIIIATQAIEISHYHNVNHHREHHIDHHVDIERNKRKKGKDSRATAGTFLNEFASF